MGKNNDGEYAEYTSFDDTDIKYAGARKVVEEEQRHICNRRGGQDPGEQLAGLAISGGGICSASFALGVLQALAWNGKLGKLDYMSTVSGGRLYWCLSDVANASLLVQDRD